MQYKAIVMGVSSGGLTALKNLLPLLPKDFSIPIMIVQHLGVYSESYWIKMLDSISNLHVKEADEKETLQKGCVYIAPPNYHLLVESDNTLSLSTEQKVNFARPSIDVLFDSAAEVYRDKLIGIILTGSNNDGTAGMKKIKENSGLTIVQDPKTAESPFMPLSVINTIKPDYILSLKKTAALLIDLNKQL